MAKDAPHFVLEDIGIDTSDGQVPLQNPTLITLSLVSRLRIIGVDLSLLTVDSV